MRLLIITEKENDLTNVLKSCNVTTHLLTAREATTADISVYDAYCVLEPGQTLDARLRERLEMENVNGKRIFMEATCSFLEFCCETPIKSVHHRLIYLEQEHNRGILGLNTGDLLDDESNLIYNPPYMREDVIPLLVYQYHIIAHTHTDMSREKILENSLSGLWLCRDTTLLMSSFILHNFNKARFAPRASWQKVINYIAEWLTGKMPSYMPAPVVTHLLKEDLSHPKTFEKYRKNSITKALCWMENLLVDNGNGGIMEGIRHEVDPEGVQQKSFKIRADCSGECAGAFKMNGLIEGRKDHTAIGENLDRFIYGPMIQKGGLCDGMMRWSSIAWEHCYADDVARAVLPGLFDCIFFGHDEHFPSIRKTLDFLIKTTAKDGTRIPCTYNHNLTEEGITKLSNTEIGLQSTHFNAYYSAALLLAYKYCKEPVYLEVGKKGLLSILSVYPDTKREQSETEEICRLILPLAILYNITGEEEHRKWLYRVTQDLEKLRHPFGGYKEWDTGYKAGRSRESTTECSILTENGDPVADQLYSVNWLPLGFAWAYLVTGDTWFRELWHNIVTFFIRTQIISEDKDIDGAWSRAFDMDLGEIYAAPHDIGWGCNACESGWTVSEIVMGMMLPDLMKDNKLSHFPEMVLV